MIKDRERCKIMITQVLLKIFHLVTEMNLLHPPRLPEKYTN